MKLINVDDLIKDVMDELGWDDKFPEKLSDNIAERNLQMFFMDCKFEELRRNSLKHLLNIINIIIDYGIKHGD